MELGLLLIAGLSAAAGLTCRKAVRPSLSRALLVLGSSTLILAFGVLGLMALGQAPFGFWTGSATMLVLITLTALVLPFALASRRRG